MNEVVTEPGSGRERGFTLVELLVAITIEAMIIAALGAAFVVILRTTTTINQSLNRSTDARTAAAYIVSDARNSSGPEISLTDKTSCADANPPVAGAQTAIVRFDWTTTASNGATSSDIVEYMLVSSSLVRRECQGGTLVSDHAVATNIASVTAVCSPTANCTGTPDSITVTVTELADASGNQYQFSLTGSFQKNFGAGAPVPTTPRSVILLGTGSTCSGSTNTIDIQGSGAMRVYGDAFINSKDGASCNAMYLANSGTFQAGGLSILTGGSCKSGTNGLVCPTSTPSTAAADPYASLTAPSTSGLPTQTGCTGSSGSQTAQPGYYPSGFSLQGGNTCTLASGVYVVAGGFNIANGVTLKTGAGGVLIYLQSGQFAVGGGASITLTAMTTGTYSGLAFWQAAADTNAISFSNGGALVFNGAIYGPKAQLNISGNAQTPLVTSLVVQTVVLSNSGGITVGAPSSPGLSITTTSLPAWPVNKAGYSATLAASGGDGDYTWALTSGTLPAGLSFDASSGIISGTPTAVVSPSLTFQLTDGLGDNPDTQAVTLAIHALPTVTSTSPASRGQGATNQNIVITGTGFVSGTGLAASFSGTGITVNSTTYTSATSVTANITIGSGASTGARDVTVTNPDTGTGTGTSKFTVNAAPTVTSASPASRGQGATSQTITVNGTGFVSGAVASFSGAGITVNSTTFVTNIKLTVVVTVAAGAATGADDVNVTNPDGGVGTGANMFTVNPAPTITTISPTSHARNATGIVVTINGTGFVSGATVAFGGSNLPTITNTTFSSSIKMTVTINIPNSANTWSITVTNPDAGTVTKTSAFAST